MGSIFKALSLITLWIMIMSLSTGDTDTFFLILSLYLSAVMIHLSFGGYKNLKVRLKINKMKRRIFKGKKYIPLTYAAELLGKKEDYIRNLNFSEYDLLSHREGLMRSSVINKLTFGTRQPDKIISKVHLNKKEFVLIAKTIIANDF